jgi:hypothetical protein
VDGDVVDMLIRLHWLSEQQANYPAAVGRAMGELFAAAARH